MANDKFPVFIWTGLFPMATPFVGFHHEYLKTRFETYVVAKRLYSEDTICQEREYVYRAIKGNKAWIRRTMRSLFTALKHPFFLARYIPPNEMKYLGRKLPFESDARSVHLAEFGTSVFLPVMLKKFGTIQGKIIVHFHGHDISSRLNVDKTYRRCLIQTLKLVDGIIVVSENQRHVLHDLGVGKDIRVIPCGAVVPRTVEKMPTPDIQFTYIGRLTVGKGVYESLQAFHECVMQRPDKHLVFNIVGGGSERDRIDQYIRVHHLSESVKMWGSIDHDRVLDLLKSTDIYIQHSKTTPTGWQEGWGVSMAEASAMEIPVIATRHGGIPDHQIDGTTGYLLDEGDWQGMAQCMLQLVDSPSTRKKMGHAGRKHIMKVGNLDIQLLKLGDYIEEVSQY